MNSTEEKRESYTSWKSHSAGEITLDMLFLPRTFLMPFSSGCSIEVKKQKLTFYPGRTLSYTPKRRLRRPGRWHNRL